MSKTHNIEPHDLDGPPQGPGALLRRSRLRQGLDEEAVCRHIGITRRTLQALERDDLGALPAAVFVRGYLRTYCQLVGLRPNPVLACFEEHSRHVHHGTTSPPAALRQQRPRALVASLGAGLMACSLVTWALYADSRSGDDRDEPVAAAVLPLATMPGHDAVDPDTSLAVRFMGDSWLQVIDANDHILAVDLYREGTQLTLEGQPPFRVTLGDPAGVSINYRGEEVSVPASAETAAGHFTVGR